MTGVQTCALPILAEMGNPMGTFAQDAVVFDPEGEVDKDDLFACYKHWALKKSIPPGTELAFKRRFIASVQEHHIKSSSTRFGGERQHVYQGVRLNEKAQKYLDSILSSDMEIF